MSALSICTAIKNLNARVGAGGAEAQRVQDLYFSQRADGVPGTGTLSDPFDASSAAKIDALLAPLSAAKTKANFHWLPGTYMINAVKPHYPPPYTPAWVWRDGWHWRGAGPERTIFKFVNDRVWPPEEDPSPPADSRIMFRWSYEPGEGEIVGCGSLRGCSIDGDTHSISDPGSGITYTQAIAIEGGSFILEDVIVENMGGRGQEMFPIAFTNGLQLEETPPPERPCFITMRRVQIRNIYQSGGGAGVLVYGQNPSPNQRFLMEDCHFKDCYICFGSFENIDLHNNYIDVGTADYSAVNFDTGTIRNVRITGNTFLNYGYSSGQVGGVNIGTIAGASTVSSPGNNSAVTAYPVPYAVDAAEDLHVEIRLTSADPEDLQDKWTTLDPDDYTVTLIPETGFASVVTDNPIANTHTVRITRWLVAYENFLISGNYFAPRNGGVFPMVRAAGGCKNLTICNNYLKSNTTVPGLGYLRDDDVYPGGDTHYWTAGVGFPVSWHPPYIPNGPIFAWGNRVVDGGYVPLGLPDTVLGDIYATGDIHAAVNFRAGNGFVGDGVKLATGFVATGGDSATKVDPYVTGTFWGNNGAKAVIEVIEPAAGSVCLNLQRTGTLPVKWVNRIPAGQTFYDIGPEGLGVDAGSLRLYITGNAELVTTGAAFSADILTPRQGTTFRTGTAWPLPADIPAGTSVEWHNTTTDTVRTCANKGGTIRMGADLT